MTNLNVSVGQSKPGSFPDGVLLGVKAGSPGMFKDPSSDMGRHDAKISLVTRSSVTKPFSF